MFSHELEVGVKCSSNRGCLAQPGPDVGVVVGGVVVEDQMHPQALGDLTIDRAQELQKLDVAVDAVGIARSPSPPGHPTRQQGRGPVALVVVGHRPCPLGLDRQRRLRTIQRLDLALLIHAQHHGLLRRV